MKANATTRIIIADDHELLRRGVRDLLVSSGYSVVAEASNGHELIEKARETEPDLVVTDLGMPGLNGVDAVRTLLKERPKMQAIVLTIHETDALIQSVLASGARGYVLKGDAAKDLTEAVREVMSGRIFLSSGLSDRLDNPDGGEARIRTLSTRELEIVQLLVAGRTSREISETLGTSVRTVETQRSDIMEKLGKKSLAELIRWAIRNNLVFP